MLVFFIIAALAIFTVEAVLTEVECFGWATLTLIATAVGVHLFHVVDLLTLVRTHAIETIYSVLVYFAVGVVWSFIKWFSFLMGFRDTYRQKKEEFVASKKAEYEARKNNPPPPVDKNARPSWGSPRENDEDKVSLTPPTEAELAAKFVKSLSHYETYRDNPLGSLPKAANNKARITAWMAFWPFSVVGTLVNDPVRRLVDFLFTQFKALYQRMSDALFSSHPELK
jgi:hypothetical protein